MLERGIDFNNDGTFDDYKEEDEEVEIDLWHISKILTIKLIKVYFNLCPFYYKTGSEALLQSPNNTASSQNKISYQITFFRIHYIKSFIFHLDFLEKIYTL